ncbi:hypothetical protein MUN82_12300 [Hymenobacter aerilatus]|uniref:Uncharacterized protein n=1 Tax=Hymenobacter aerilatus TaxID=2932251 RepID=A0A8T9SVD5_9BACT|nr:hypothetical protein [Hymenobacter aerilatus]UOR03729.1 hypothetical protein MUN82_12300 [Hymenobacter aerilatus]
MPRTPTFPDTADEIKRLELSDLRQRGLLRPGYHSTTLRWSRNGHPSGSVGLDVVLLDDQSYLRLHYTLNDTTRYDYRIELEAVPTNLGNGFRYYMICPVSGRRATVLYLRDGTGKFAHRLAYGPTRLFYGSQLESKTFRGLSSYFAVDREWEKHYKKGRKTHYQGKPTKWYARLLKLGEKADALAPAMDKLLNGYR